MWRFILSSFFFLGLSFYEMSGGADYRPSANSIQARAVLDNQRPRARPLRVNVIALAQPDTGLPETGTAPAITSLRDLALRMDRPDTVVLPAAKEPSAPLPTVVNLTFPTISLAPTPLFETTAAADQAPHSQREDGFSAAMPDLRRVVATSVNLRAGPGTQFGRLARLTNGTAVSVLRDPGDGWVKVRLAETGRIGWLSERLLTAAAE